MHPGIGFDATGLRSDGSMRGTAARNLRFGQVRYSRREMGRQLAAVSTLGCVAVGGAPA